MKGLFFSSLGGRCPERVQTKKNVKLLGEGTGEPYGGNAARSRLTEGEEKWRH
jgi:hypothetical protein